MEVGLAADQLDVRVSNVAALSIAESEGSAVVIVEGDVVGDRGRGSCLPKRGLTAPPASPGAALAGLGPSAVSKTPIGCMPTSVDPSRNRPRARHAAHSAMGSGSRVVWP